MQYLVRIRGRVLGPFPLDVLRDLARRGQVTRVHEVSVDGMVWTVATGFPEIFSTCCAVKAAAVADGAYVQTGLPPVVAVSPCPTESPPGIHRSDSSWGNGSLRTVAIVSGGAGGIGLLVCLLAWVASDGSRGQARRQVASPAAESAVTPRYEEEARVNRTQQVQAVDQAVSKAFDEPAVVRTTGSTVDRVGGSNVYQHPGVPKALSPELLESAAKQVVAPQLQPSVGGYGIPPFGRDGPSRTDIACWKMPASVSLLQRIELELPHLGDMPQNYRLVLRKRSTTDGSDDSPEHEGRQALVMWDCGTESEPSGVGTFSLSGTTLSFAYASSPSVGHGLLPLLPIHMRDSGTSGRGVMMVPAVTKCDVGVVRGCDAEMPLPRMADLPAEVCTALSQRLRLQDAAVSLGLAEDLPIEVIASSDKQVFTDSAVFPGRNGATVQLWWRPRTGGETAVEVREPLFITTSITTTTGDEELSGGARIVVRPMAPVTDPMVTLVTKISPNLRSRILPFLPSTTSPGRPTIDYDGFVSAMAILVLRTSRESGAFADLRDFLDSRKPAQPSFDGLIDEVKNCIAARSPSSSDGRAGTPQEFRQWVENRVSKEGKEGSEERVLNDEIQLASFWRMLHVYGILRRAGLPPPEKDTPSIFLHVNRFRGRVQLDWQFGGKTDPEHVYATLAEVDAVCRVPLQQRRPKAVLWPTDRSDKLQSPTPAGWVSHKPLEGYPR